ncbi:MAG TPA: 1-deoxy-D-xylulose-5-phosphate reductoisomerase [Acidobacteriota bacterium]
MNKKIAILGSTGSIGQSTLDVVRQSRGRFEVVALVGGTNTEALCDQIREFAPRIASVVDSRHADVLHRQLTNRGIAAPQILCGDEGAIAAATQQDVELVVGAISGAAGLIPTYHAIEQGKRLALANKETLVMAGDLIMPLARKNGCSILPVDSEHNALHQCLQAVQPDQVDELLLTASGGPFLNLPLHCMATVSVREALRHPTWRMGKKITIDSATLMNKGLEIIEAHHLFNFPPDKIRVLIHPKSVIHSLVRTTDGSLIAQMGITDMRLPILYALNYPERLPSPFPALDLTAVGPLEFFSPDLARFPCLKLAYEALRTGGTLPTVMNAANEVAVSQFLGEEIPFSAIPVIIEHAMSEHKAEAVRDLDQILQIDREARTRAQRIIKGMLRSP